jgi:hypothetical protein
METKPCDKEKGVFYSDIVLAYLDITKRILRLLMKVIRFVVTTLYSIFTFILGYILFLLPFSPFGIFIWCVITLLVVLWDKITKPIIENLIQAYNGVAKGWNMVANSVRDIGIHERFFGKNIDITLFSINLPSASIIKPKIDGFWTFIYKILTPDVIKKKVLSKIFRDPDYVPPEEEDTLLNKI